MSTEEEHPDGWDPGGRDPQSVGSEGTAPGGPAGGAEPSEEELRAAYEAELARITTADMLLQTAASLLNIGGLRLGLVPDATVERDLEQVRDAIDGVRALLPILERHSLPQLRPLRDALSQLQMAYTREVQNEARPPAPAAAAPAAATSAPPAGGGQPAGSPPKQSRAPKPSEGSSGPGPAESSGRLWVPGR
jgi:hypothetical protein